MKSRWLFILPDCFLFCVTLWAVLLNSLVFLRGSNVWALWWSCWTAWPWECTSPVRTSTAPQTDAKYCRYIQTHAYKQTQTYFLGSYFFVTKCRRSQICAHFLKSFHFFGFLQIVRTVFCGLCSFVLMFWHTHTHIDVFTVHLLIHHMGPVWNTVCL